MNQSEILSPLKEKRYSEVKAAMKDMNVVDLAEVFEELYELDGQETMLRLFRLMPKEIAAETFSYMESDVRQNLIEALSDKELSYILDDMYMDDYVDLVEEMPANVVMRLMKNSSRENRSLINEYLQYPEDSAGSIMTNEYVYLKRRLTVKQAFDIIRTNGVDKETIYTCYVISGERKLEGVVTIRELLLADPNVAVDSLMSTNVISAHTLDDKEEVAKLFSKYDMLSLPVVDKEERLVGIITVDDAVDVIQDEATEDFEGMAGVTPSEDSYLKTSVFALAKHRIVWLLILMVSAMITGGLLEKFESAIATIPLLVAFIPMLMDTGGNSGSQAATMIIRGMALDEIELRDIFRVWWKEIRVAVLVSLGLSIVNFARIWIQYGDLEVAAVVSATMIATIMIAKSLGVVLPMLAAKLKLDPAIMAAPMITTVTDACSILVYFTLATHLLSARL